MSQKIVIKANVKREPHNSVATLSYEWNWRRIVSTAMLIIMTLAAIIYGLTASVNAEQDKPENTSEGLLISTSNVDAEPATPANEDVVANMVVTARSMQPQGQQKNSAAGKVDDSVVFPATGSTMQSARAEPLSIVAESTPEQAAEKPQSDVAKLSPNQNPVPNNNVLTAVDSDNQALTSAQNFAPLAKIASVALGAQIDTDKISRAVLTRSVSKREPVNVFAADIRLSQFNGSLSFFSELKNLQGQHVKHVWLFAGKKMAEIKLSVTSPRYRTYSTKRISDSQVGHWRVDVIDEQGILLAQKEFRILAD